jgi:hypothetical protein
METEHREIRFGLVAIRQGFVTADQVVEALRIQIEEDLSAGKHRRIGTILLDQGLIALSQINEVLDSMGVPFP